MSNLVVIVMSEEFIRRITPALVKHMRDSQDFRILNIDRPISELRFYVELYRPKALICEWLPEVTDALLALGIPTVIADTDRVYESAISVNVDDFAVGVTAAKSFQQLGHQHLACIGNELPYSDQRIDGFKSQFSSAVSVYLELDVSIGNYSEYLLNPRPELVNWLSALPKPVGIFAVHDPLGRFLIGCCQSLDLLVPEQVAIIGANDDELVCSLSHPMLSSVTIPWEKLGDSVLDALQELSSGKPLPQRPYLVPPGPVVSRHSSHYRCISDALMRRCLDFYDAHLEEAINVTALCDELKLSRRQVERKFRAYFQCSPHHMLTRMRIERAKKRLLETQLPIADIAVKSGFTDVARFSAVFRRMEQQSPSQWRRART